MRFILKNSGLSGERVGMLTEFVRRPSIEIETPTAAILTQCGSVVHLTAEVLAKVFPNPQLLWVPLSNSVHMENGLKAQGEGVGKFAAVQDHVTCITLQNMNEVTPAGHFETDKVPLWTKHGKKMISADRYMDLMEVFKPDIILAVADGRTSLDESHKRITKSVHRTANMLNTCVQRYKDSNELQNSSLVGVIVGGAVSKRCEESVENVLRHKDILGGIALSGMTDGTEESASKPIEKLETIFKNVAGSIPKNLLHVVEGCWNPAVILTAISYGWDVFDGSYAVKMSNLGQALTYNFDITKGCNSIYLLDLIDVCYNDQFVPIVENCACLTCTKHTRAYIRHLLNTKEMLASVLLSIHNLHHFDQMFYHARQHIKSNTFDAYKNHIVEQYNAYRESYVKPDFEDSVKQSPQLKKKSKVDNVLPYSNNKDNSDST